MSFFGFIAKPLGYLLTGIYDVVGSYGITLIIFTVIVRLCLFPIYLHQTRNSLKMADVQPKMQEIQKKYANDKEELNRRLMELYKQENYNPMKGCLPMLIQFPILMGLFTLLRDPLSYMPSGSTHMVLAVHESFLWVPDLSQSDLWILPIITGIAQFFSFSLSQMQMQSPGANPNQMMGMMKVMKYVFPVMLVYLGRTFPAGLALYWFIGNLCAILQNQVLRIWKKKMERDKAEGKGSFSPERAKKQKQKKAIKEKDLPKLD